MRKDLLKIQPLRSSFLSCEKDTQTILKTLFVDSKPYSDMLKRLLIINNPDCLDTQNTDYKRMIDSKSLGQLIEEGYIRLNPKIARGTFENIKSYILISFDNFSSSKNPEFRDCTINFDIICYMDEWCLDDYQVRPLKICGYIDGILNSLTDNNKKTLSKSLGNNIKMSGFGAYQFMGCNLAVLNQDISMYTLSYRGVHFTEDLDTIGEIQDA